MMNDHLKKIKILFSFFVFLLVVVIITASFGMKENYFLSQNYLEYTINYLNYKWSFSYVNGKGLNATIFSIFNNEQILKNNKDIKSIPVLLYHSIINKPDGSNVLLENFKDQMFAMKKEGWQTVSLEDFYQFMKSEKTLPEKSFLLTFDDGTKGSYYPVDPLLKSLNYRAVSFIITNNIKNEGNGNYHLSKNELSRMIKSGRWDIQPHAKNGHSFYDIDSQGTKGHFYSNKLWLEKEQRLETDKEFKQRVFDDLLGARNDLKNNFGIDTIGFAYPFGDFGQNSINFAEAENIIKKSVKSVYPMSFYQIWGPNPKTNYPQPDTEHLAIKRISVDPQWNAGDLLKILQESIDKNLPYYDDLEKNNGWEKNWGSLNFADNSITIKADKSTTGSATFLNGTYLWNHYIFKAETYLKKGQVFSLVAGHKDNENYTACSFSDKYIRIEQVLNGEKKILSELKGNFRFIGKNRETGIGTYGDIVDCYLDGKIVARGFNQNKEPNVGSIGFKTWDPQIDNSELIIKKISVEEIK